MPLSQHCGRGIWRLPPVQNGACARACNYCVPVLASSFSPKDCFDNCFLSQSRRREQFRLEAMDKEAKEWEAKIAFEVSVSSVAAIKLPSARQPALQESSSSNLQPSRHRSAVKSARRQRRREPRREERSATRRRCCGPGGPRRIFSGGTKLCVGRSALLRRLASLNFALCYDAPSRRRRNRRGRRGLLGRVGTSRQTARTTRSRPTGTSPPPTSTERCWGAGRHLISRDAARRSSSLVAAGGLVTNCWTPSMTTVAAATRGREN